LIEAAWHHRKPYRPGVELRRRQDRATPAARDRGQRANQRLHARWVGFDARRKRAVVANTAVARELAGRCTRGDRGDGRPRGVRAELAAILVDDAGEMVTTVAVRSSRVSASRTRLWPAVVGMPSTMAHR
jgi:hypothetical protein